MSEFLPRKSIETVFRYWYLMPLLSLIGAGVGWGIHLFRPPLYEAKSVFTVNINYSQPDVLDKIDDDHYAEDQMVVTVMSGMQSSEVLNQVIAEGESLGIPPTDLTLGKRLIVERKTSDIILTVRAQDPQVAVQLANSWAEHALEYLQEGQVHALRTYTLNQMIKNLSACIQTGQKDTQGLCTDINLQELTLKLQQAEAELVVETQASRGLNPAILFDFSRRADLPNTPAVIQSQVLVLAGAFIGLLFSLLIGQKPRMRSGALEEAALRREG